MNDDIDAIVVEGDNARLYIDVEDGEYEYQRDRDEYGNAESRVKTVVETTTLHIRNVGDIIIE